MQKQAMTALHPRDSGDTISPVRQDDRPSYDVLRLLSEGSFGRVELVVEHTSKQERVRRIMDVAKKRPDEVEATRKQIQSISRLTHPGIVKLFSFTEDVNKQQVSLMLEYVPGGNCSDLLSQHGFRLGEELVAKLAHQLVDSLAHCHSRGFIHKGVRPWNMLLTGKNDANGLPDCKLALYHYRVVPKAVAGSAPYLAPEIADKRQDCSPRSDMWAVGIAIFELLSGVAPFGKPADHNGNAEPVADRIKTYANFGELELVLKKSPGWKKRSSDAFDFLRQLLKADAKQRPSARDISKHAWFKQHKPNPDGLTREILECLVGYANAPLLERQCIFTIAARTDPSDLEHCRSAFMYVDGDRDGKISRKDLDTAFRKLRGWWLPDINVDALFRAMDLDRNGTIEYMEFVAACIHARLAPLDMWLADEAFAALDREQIGMLRAPDVIPFFGDLPVGLPVNRPFDKDEWRWCILPLGSCPDEVGQRSANKPLIEKKSKKTSSFFDTGILDLFFGGCANSISSSNADEAIVDNWDKMPLKLPPGNRASRMSSPTSVCSYGGLAGAQQIYVAPYQTHYPPSTFEGQLANRMSSPEYVPAN